MRRFDPTNSETMNKQALLSRIGSQLMNDYNAWGNDLLLEELNNSGAFFGSVNDSAQDVHALTIIDRGNEDSN